MGPLQMSQFQDRPVIQRQHSLQYEIELEACTVCSQSSSNKSTAVVQFFFGPCSAKTAVPGLEIDHVSAVSGTEYGIL